MKNTAVSSPVRNSGTRSWWSATLSMQRRCCCSGAKSCPTICEPMDFSMPGFPVLHCLAEFAQVHVHWIGVLSNHLILWHPLLLLPSIFPNIRIFSSESVLLIMWPKYWSFHFTISPSNDYLGLISFRINWFDILAVRGTLKSLLQHHSSKASTLQHSTFFIVQLSHPYMTTGKTIALTRWTFVGQVMSLLFNMLSRYVIAFLPRSKRPLISWLQSPSVILEPSKICHCFYFSPSICHEVMGLDAMILDFWMLSFKPACRREDLGKDIQETWVLVLVLWINVTFGSVPFHWSFFLSIKWESQADGLGGTSLSCCC